MAAYFDDRYEDINYANDIYDSGPAEWITESGTYLDDLDVADDDGWDDEDFEDDDCPNGVNEFYDDPNDY